MVPFYKYFPTVDSVPSVLRAVTFPRHVAGGNEGFKCSTDVSKSSTVQSANTILTKQ